MKKLDLASFYIQYAAEINQGTFSYNDPVFMFSKFIYVYLDKINFVYLGMISSSQAKIL